MANTPKTKPTDLTPVLDLSDSDEPIDAEALIEDIQNALLYLDDLIRETQRPLETAFVLLQARIDASTPSPLTSDHLMSLLEQAHAGWRSYPHEVSYYLNRINPDTL